MPNTWGYGGSPPQILLGYLHKSLTGGQFVLVMAGPQEYGVETFDTDPYIWPETDDTKTNSWRYTGDPAPRDSVMAIQGKSWKLGDGVKLGDGYYLGDSPVGKGEGTYKDYAVEPSVKYLLTCLYRMERGSLTIQVYDQTNGVEIDVEHRTETSWSSAQLSFTAPAGCTTVRIRFLQKADNQRPGPFLVDDVALNGNILSKDPDEYERIPERVGAFHQTLSGRRVYDLRAIHYRFHLGWTYFSQEQYEALRAAFYSNELLYLDDGDVPALVERDTVYDTDEYNYQGIENPSSTHKAYSDSSSSLPSGKADFETTEFSTADYQAVDEDDSNYKETTNPTADEYLYHKFLLLSSIAQSAVQRFRVRIASLSDDSSAQNIDGCVLYGWNGSNWVEIAKTSNSSKSYMTYSTAESEIAKLFVDSSDSYVRLLIRSGNRRIGANNLSLRTYYVECEINEGLNLTVELSHKAILDENNDVIWVKNLTQGTTLVKDTDYTIAADRRSVTVSGQTSGDEIEIKYNRYFEVMFSSIPEEWCNRDADSKERRVEVALETLSESR